MPSPFLGMDHFLEHPAIFPGLHNRMVATLSESLQASLPAPYFAEIGERVWVEESGIEGSGFIPIDEPADTKGWARADCRDCPGFEGDDGFLITRDAGGRE